MTKFTREMARQMTPDEIVAFWKSRQAETREYDRLIDAETGAVIADAAD